MKRKRRFFTLIEMVISLALLSTLLTTLFFWYGHLKRDQIQAAFAKAPFTEEYYAAKRLEKIIPKATLTSGDEQEITLFYSEGPGLSFSFDNGPNREPLLSNVVLGHLYLESETQSLCLGIWPSPMKEEGIREIPVQKTVLLEDVNAFLIEYYCPPPTTSLAVDPEEVGECKPLVGWQDVWLQDYKALPSNIRITVARPQTPHVKERSVVYQFDLYSSDHTIVHLPSKEGKVS